MKLFTGTYYTVTDEAITPTGKTETYGAKDRDEALLMALYTHRLHNGRAWGTPRGVINCPSCGQIAITIQPEQPAPPMVDTGEGAPQYTFFADGDQPTQLSLL